MHRRDIEQKSNIKYNQLLDCIKWTNLSIQKHVYYAQKYQHKERYNEGSVKELLMHRKNILKTPNTKQTQGAYSIKFTDVSHRT